MYKIFLLLIIMIFPLLSDIDADIKVNLEKKEIKANRMMFGLFFEFLHEWMGGPFGLWAQEIQNRGFDWEIDGAPKYWYTPPEQEISSYLNFGGYNTKGIYYVSLNKGESIFQDILVDELVGYEFYLYAKSLSLESSLEINFYEFKNDNLLFSEKLSLNSEDWKKYVKELDFPEGVFKVKMQILNSGADQIDIDEISLIPDNNVMGIRNRYHQLIQELNPGIIRYPGGGFADSPNNFWLDGVGPIDQRRSPSLYWGDKIERFEFGYDEFLQYCEEFNIEPHIVANFDQDYEDLPAEINAFNLLQYCNSETGYQFSDLRDQNGRNTPYKVKYWEMGNEMLYKHSELSYSKKYNKMYDEMKKVDQSIDLKFINNGIENKEVFDSLAMLSKDKVDIYGYHLGWGYPPTQTGTEKQKFLLQVSINDFFETKIDSMINWIDYSNQNMIQANTEWWTWFDGNGLWLDTSKVNNSMVSAISNAGFITSHQKYPDDMYLLERTFQLGLFSKELDENYKRHIVKRTNYDAISLLANHTGNYIHEAEFTSATYFMQSDSVWMGKPSKYIDGNVTSTDDSLFITIINRSPDEKMNVKMEYGKLLLGDQVNVYSLKSDDFSSIRWGLDTSSVYRVNSKTNLIDSFEVDPHSINVFAMKILGISSVYDDQFIIYPNPVKDFLKMDISKFDQVPISCEIVDLSGKTYIPELNFNDKILILETNNLDEGMYIIKLKFSNFEVSKKFIKN